jgi:hypothetical protein
MPSGFRSSIIEKTGLLEKLLEADFPGRDELRAQLGSVTTEQIAERRDAKNEDHWIRSVFSGGGKCLSFRSQLYRQGICFGLGDSRLFV